MISHFRIRARLLLAAGLPAIVAIALLVLGYLDHHERALTDMLRGRVQAEAKQLASLAEFSLFAGDTQELGRMIERVQSADAEVDAVAVYARDGKLLVSRGMLTGGLREFREQPWTYTAGQRLVAVVPIRSTELSEADPFSDQPAWGGVRRSQLQGYAVVEFGLGVLERERSDLLRRALLSAAAALLAAGLLSALIASSVTGPMARIGQGVARLSGGELDARIDPARAGVLRSLAEGINEMASSLARNEEELRRRVEEATSELRQQRDEAERTARIDALTGLLNRRAFVEAARGAIEFARRKSCSLALVAVDLDHFKAVNDNHGHATGDAVLMDFARVVSGQLRASDHAGRLGGEEFALLLPGTGAVGAVQLAERVRRALAASELTAPGGAVLRYSASFGVAEIRLGESSLDTLLARADTALYQAKRNGRNRVELARDPGAAPA